MAVKQQGIENTAVDANNTVIERTSSYFVTDVTTAAEATSKVHAIAPKSIDNMQLNKISVQENHGNGTFIIDANYAPMTPSEFLKVTPDRTPVKCSFSTIGGSAVRTQAIKQVKTPDAINMNLGINFNGESFEGVEVATRNLTETYTKTFKANHYNSAYKRTLALLSGKVNKEPFKGWDAGEVLFLGATTNYSSADKYIDVTFQFAIELNKKGFNFAGFVLDKRKCGWDYMWAHYQDEVYQNGNKKTLIPKAKGVYIARVYDFAIFTALGI